MSDSPRTYTVKDIQAILHISRTAAYALIRDPPFSVIRIGRTIRVAREVFDKWLTGV